MQQATLRLTVPRAKSLFAVMKLFGFRQTEFVCFLHIGTVCKVLNNNANSRSGLFMTSKHCTQLSFV